MTLELPGPTARSAVGPANRPATTDHITVPTRETGALTGPVVSMAPVPDAGDAPGVSGPRGRRSRLSESN